MGCLTQIPSLSLHTQLQEALPIVGHFLGRLGLSGLLAPQIPHRPYQEALDLLVKSILLQPNALYRIEAWARSYDPAWRPRTHLGDDVLGRALDRLFEADRASLLTALVLCAVKNFSLQTDELHNDSTTLAFAGAYEHQKTKALQLRQGCSKDHRPDLKQLVYCLSVSADGAVPVHFKAYSGNQADDPTHWETWQRLCQILGRSDFLYVADSKLCVKETMLQIAQQQGRFLTIMPRTRSEWTTFAEQATAQQVVWEALWSRRSLRHSHCREQFQLAAGTRQTTEGFALHWYRSSDKRRRDAQDRQQRLEAALQRLGRLNERRGRGPKTQCAVRRAAQNILARYHLEALVQYEIRLIVAGFEFTRMTR